MLFIDRQKDMASLQDYAFRFNTQFNETISKQAIQQRVNTPNALLFLKTVLEKAIGKQLSALYPYAQHKSMDFKQILIKDSVRFKVADSCVDIFKGGKGNTGRAKVSIQFEYDLLSGKVTCLELTPSTRNDYQDSRENLDKIESGNLYLKDLGYITHQYIEHVADAGSYYICRVHRGWNLHDADKQIIDYKQIISKLSKNNLEFIDMEALIKKGNRWIPTRAVFSLVSEQEYQKRLKKIKKNTENHGGTVGEKTKMVAKLNMFITNMDKGQLDTQQVRHIYYLRWQIELAFKTWKQQGQIDVRRQMNPNRFQCHLIARLIWLMLHWQILVIIQGWYYRQGIEARASMIKVFKIAKYANEHCKTCFLNPTIENMEKWMGNWFKQPCRLLAAEQKRGKVSAFKALKFLLA